MYFAEEENFLCEAMRKAKKRNVFLFFKTEIRDLELETDIS